MTQLLIRFLVIALLFSSAYAAAEAVCVDFDDQHKEQTSMLDHDISDTDNQNDCCDQFCQCLTQAGLIYTYSDSLSKTSLTSKISNYYNYYSLSPSPLFRPPIS